MENPRVVHEGRRVVRWKVAGRPARKTDEVG